MNLHGLASRYLLPVLRRSAALESIRIATSAWINEHEFKDWERGGRLGPPPHLVKQGVLIEYAERYHLDVLVETGTFLGDMVAAMRTRFRRVFSIELQPELCRRAQERFAANDNVEILLGDSGKVIPSVLGQLKAPALFWLDGHYSAGPTARGEVDTPVLAEIHHVLSDQRFRHVALIDDARLFDGENDYPSIADLRAYVAVRRPDAIVEVRDDVIRIT